MFSQKCTVSIFIVSGCYSSLQSDLRTEAVCMGSIIYCSRVQLSHKYFICHIISRDLKDRQSDYIV